jgi:hypothetical protein
MMPFISNYRYCSVLGVHELFGVTHIEAIEFRDTVVCDELRDCRISLRQPSEELWDALLKREVRALHMEHIQDWELPFSLLVRWLSGCSAWQVTWERLDDHA